MTTSPDPVYDPFGEVYVAAAFEVTEERVERAAQAGFHQWVHSSLISTFSGKTWDTEPYDSKLTWRTFAQRMLKAAAEIPDAPFGEV